MTNKLLTRTDDPCWATVKVGLWSVMVDGVTVTSTMPFDTADAQMCRQASGWVLVMRVNIGLSIIRFQPVVVDNVPPVTPASTDDPATMAAVNLLIDILGP